MSYTFQFGVLAQYQGEILSGIWLTIKLSILSIVLGSAAGVMLASLRSIKGGAVRYLVDAYVEVIRNTPFLVQLFIVYFGLPGLGIRVGADTAALIGMTINLAAYSTEIIRAGIEAVPQIADRSGRGAWLLAFPDLSPRHSGAGGRQGLSGAVQPVRVDDAGLQHLLGNFDP